MTSRVPPKSRTPRKRPQRARLLAAQSKRRNLALFKSLRDAARSSRTNKPRLFYSIREVAQSFHCSPTTVWRIFDRLKSEGILRNSWGSRTIVEAKRLNRKLQVRGIITLLISLESFSDQRDFRTLCKTVSDKLWKLGFAFRFCFYELREAEDPAFIKNVIGEKPDVIVWLDRAARATQLTRGLRDCGIRVIRVTDDLDGLREFATAWTPARAARQKTSENRD